MAKDYIPISEYNKLKEANGGKDLTKQQVSSYISARSSGSSKQKARTAALGGGSSSNTKQKTNAEILAENMQGFIGDYQNSYNAAVENYNNRLQQQFQGGTANNLARNQDLATMRMANDQAQRYSSVLNRYGNAFNSEYTQAANDALNELLGAGKNLNKAMQANADYWGQFKNEEDYKAAVDYNRALTLNVDKANDRIKELNDERAKLAGQPHGVSGGVTLFQSQEAKDRNARLKAIDDEIAQLNADIYAHEQYVTGPIEAQKKEQYYSTVNVPELQAQLAEKEQQLKDLDDNQYQYTTTGRDYEYSSARTSLTEEISRLKNDIHVATSKQYYSNTMQDAQSAADFNAASAFVAPEGVSTEDWYKRRIDAGETVGDYFKRIMGGEPSDNTDKRYLYINGDAYTRENMDNASIVSAGTESGAWQNIFGATDYHGDMSIFRYMTEEEVKVYNYLYNTQGKDRADEFLDSASLHEVLNARKAEHSAQVDAKVASEHNGVASVASVLASPLNGIAYFGQAADYLGDGYIDKNAQYNSAIKTNTMFRSTVSRDVEQKWGKVGSFIYNTGMSMADFIYQSALTRGLASAGSVGAKVAEAFTLGIMGTGAAANGTLEALDRGLSSDKAFALGTIAGAAEIISEKVSIEALFENAAINSDALKYFLQNALFEGSEEVFSDVINGIADIIVSRSQSEWNEAIAHYQEQYMTKEQAFIRAMKDQALSMGLDFLGGFLSGGAMAVGGIAVNNRFNKSVGADLATIGEDENGKPKYTNLDALANSLIEDAKTMDQDSEAGKVAADIEAKRAKGKKVTLQDLGRLFEATTNSKAKALGIEEDKYREQYQAEIARRRFENVAAAELVNEGKIKVEEATRGKAVEKGIEKSVEAYVSDIADERYRNARKGKNKEYYFLGTINDGEEVVSFSDLKSIEWDQEHGLMFEVEHEDGTKSDVPLTSFNTGEDIGDAFELARMVCEGSDITDASVLSDVARTAIAARMAGNITSDQLLPGFLSIYGAARRGMEYLDALTASVGDTARASVNRMTDEQKQLAFRAGDNAGRIMSAKDGSRNMGKGLAVRITGRITKTMSQKLAALNDFMVALGRHAEIYDAINLVELRNGRQDKQITVWQDPSTKRINGVKINEDDGSVRYIFAANSVDTSFLFVAVHESLHDIRANLKAENGLSGEQVYRKMLALVADFYQKQGVYNDMLVEQIRLLGVKDKNDIKAIMSDHANDRLLDAAQEELVANALPAILANRSTMEQFALMVAEADGATRNAFERFIYNVKHFLAEALEILTHNEHAKSWGMLKKIAENQRLVDDLYALYEDAFTRLAKQNAAPSQMVGQEFTQAQANDIVMDSASEITEMPKVKMSSADNVEVVNGVVIDASESEEFQEMQREYANSVDENILAEAKKYHSDKGAEYNRIKVSDVSEKQAAEVERIVGVNVRGFTNNMDKTSFNHIEKRHGENGTQDNSMADLRDVARVGWVLENFDYCFRTLGQNGKLKFSSRNNGANGKSAPLVTFGKRIDGVHYVSVTAVDNKYKKLWVETCFKSKKEVTQASNAMALDETSETGPVSPSFSNNVPSINESVNNTKVIDEKYSYATYAEPDIKPGLTKAKATKTLGMSPEDITMVANTTNGKKDVVYASGRSVLEAVMKKYAKDNHMSPAMQKATLRFMDRIGKWMDEVAVANYHYIGLQDLNNAKMKIDWRNGKKVVLSARVKNGEYDVNFDLSKICKKRVAFSNFIDDLATRPGKNGKATMLDEIDLSRENIFKMNQILKDMGYETACLGCFVESRRYGIKTWAETIVNEWNARVDQIDPNAGYFDFAGGSTSADIDTISAKEIRDIDNYMKDFKQRVKDVGADVASEENKAKIAALEEEKKQRKAEISASKTMSKDEKKVARNQIDAEYNPQIAELKMNAQAKMLPLMQSDPRMLKKLRVGDLISSQGRTALHEYSAELESIVASRFGTSSPKSVEAFAPYNSEIALLPDTKSIGRGENKVTMSMGEYLSSIAGARSQSFSDFIISQVYDHLQKTADLAARGFKAHTYTKEIARAMLFGMTGEKINMSVMFDINPDVDWQYAGLEGNSMDSDYSVADYKHAAAVEGKTGEKQFTYSIPFAKAVEIEHNPLYSKDCGIIGVGHSYFGMLKMFRDERIPYIIGYHRSGMPEAIMKATHIELSADYTSVQNTLKFGSGVQFRVVNNAGDYQVPSYATWGGSAKKDVKASDLTFDLKQALADNGGDGRAAMQAFLDFMQDNSLTPNVSKAVPGHGSFDLYGDLEKTMDPNKTANNYIAWCINNNMVPMFYEFAAEPEYSKILFDFSVRDLANNGACSPQRAVSMDGLIALGEDAWESIASRFMKQYDDYMKEQFFGNKYEETLNQIYDSILADELRPYDMSAPQNASEAIEAAQKFSVVDDDWSNVTHDDKENARRDFETGNTTKVYRAMQLVDGKLYPPMAAVVDGKMVGGVVEGDIVVSDERPDLAILQYWDKDGKYRVKKTSPLYGKTYKAGDVKLDEETGEPAYVFQLVKGTKSDDGKKQTDVPARYNPYIHTSRSMINDQFSSAWKRSHLVTVEVEIPNSELTAGYWAEKAKDAVGEMTWKSGPVSGQLAEVGDPRKVILSRYCKIGAIIPTEEVAKLYADKVVKHGIEVPFNTVQPALRDELAKNGVKIGPPESGSAGKSAVPSYNEWAKKHADQKFSVADGSLFDAYESGSVVKANDVFGEFYRLNSNAESETLARKVFDACRRLNIVYTVHETEINNFNSVNVKDTKKISAKAAGVTRGSRVRFNKEFFADPGYDMQSKADVILHESIHAVTSFAIDLFESSDGVGTIKVSKPDPEGGYTASNLANRNITDEAVIKRIKSVYNVDVNSDEFTALADFYDTIAAAYDAMELSFEAYGEYGMTNKKEFIAELANDEFRKKLKGKGFLQELLDAFLRLIGVSKEGDYSVYSVTYDALEKFLSMDMSKISDRRDMYMQYQYMQTYGQKFSIADSFDSDEDAEAAGYIPVWHGTDTRVNAKDVDTTKGSNGATQYGAGFYLTDGYGIAESHVKDRTGKSVPPAKYYVNPADMLDLRSVAYWEDEFIPSITGALKEKYGMTDAQIRRIRNWGYSALADELNKRSNVADTGFFKNTDEANKLIRSLGYKGIIADYQDSTQYVVFDKSVLADAKEEDVVNETVGTQKFYRMDTSIELSQKDRNDLFADNYDTYGKNQSDIDAYVDAAYERSGKPNNPNEDEYIQYATADERLINDLREELDVSNKTHIIRARDVRHIINSHGESTNEKYPVTAADQKLIPEIVKNYDKVFIAKHNGRKGIVYVKLAPNGIVYYLEQIVSGNNILVNKQMIKTGIDDIPSTSGIREAIEKKQPVSEFLNDLKEIPKMYVQDVVRPTAVSDETVPSSEPSVKMSIADTDDTRSVRDAIRENEKTLKLLAKLNGGDDSPIVRSEKLSRRQMNAIARELCERYGSSAKYKEVADILYEAFGPIFDPSVEVDSMQLLSDAAAQIVDNVFMEGSGAAKLDEMLSAINAKEKRFELTKEGGTETKEVRRKIMLTSAETQEIKSSFGTFNAFKSYLKKLGVTSLFVAYNAKEAGSAYMSDSFFADLANSEVGYLFPYEYDGSQVMSLIGELDKLNDHKLVNVYGKGMETRENAIMEIVDELIARSAEYRSEAMSERISRQAGDVMSKEEEKRVGALAKQLSETAQEVRAQMERYQAEQKALNARTAEMVYEAYQEDVLDYEEQIRVLNEQLKEIRSLDEKRRNAQRKTEQALSEVKSKLMSARDHLKARASSLAQMDAYYARELAVNVDAQAQMARAEARKEMAAKYKQQIEKLRNDKKLQAKDLSETMTAYNKVLADVTRQAKKDVRTAHKEGRLQRSAEVLERDLRRNYRARIAARTKTMLKMLNGTANVVVPEGARNTIGQFVDIMSQQNKKFDKDQLRLFAQFYRNMGKGTIIGDEAQDLQNMFDEDIADRFDQLIDIIGGKRISELTSDELRQTLDITNVFYHIARHADDVRRRGRSESMKKDAMSLFRQLNAEADRKGHGQILDNVEGFLVNNQTPYYFFKQAGGVLEKYYQDIDNGVRQYTLNVQESQKRIQEIKDQFNYDEWSKDTDENRIQFEAATHRQVSLTRGEAMLIWATNKREQINAAQKADHLRGGGIVLQEDRKNGKNKALTAVANRLTDENLQYIDNWLTPEQKACADALVQYLSADMAELGNEVTMQLYGIRKFDEPYYIPYNCAGTYLNKRVGTGAVNLDNMLKTISFTQKLTTRADAPILVDDIFNVASRHIERMTMYNALCIPLDNMNRLMNYKTRERIAVDENGHPIDVPLDGDGNPIPLYNEDGTINADVIDIHYDENGNPLTKSVVGDSIRTMLTAKRGTNAVKYIDQFIDDMNGGANTDPRESFGSRMLSLFKKNAVMMSLSVAIQQPSAIGRAFALVDPKYFAQGMATKGSYEELKKYSYTAVLKEIGGFDTGTGRGIADWINGGYEAPTKTKQVLNKIDEVGGYLPGKTDELTWGVIWRAIKLETEAKNPDLHGEDLLRAAGARFDEVINATQVYDSTISRSSNMRSKTWYMKAATAFMAEPTVSYNLLVDAVKQAKNGNAKYAGRAIASFAVAAIINSLLKSLVTAARKQDDDETYGEKYLAEVTGNLFEELNPFGLVPIAKDVISIFDGYTVNRSDMDAIQDIKDAYDTLMNDNKSAMDKINATAAAISITTGVPIRNVLRDSEAVYNVISHGISMAGKGSAQGTRLAMEEALSDVWPFSMWVKSSNKDYAARIIKDYKAGDIEAVEATIRDYQFKLDRQGKSAEDIGKKTESWIKKAVKEAYDAKEIDYDSAFKLLTEIGEIAEKVAFKTLQAADYDDTEYADSSSAYVGVYDAIDNGGDVEAAIGKMVKSGYEEKTVRQQAVYGILELYKGKVEGKAKISDAQARTMLTKYGKLSSDDAAKKIKEANVFLTYGVEYSSNYSKLKEALKAGTLSKEQAIKILMNVRGYTRDKAKGIVDKW